MMVNLSSGTTSQTEVIAQEGGVEVLVRLLAKSPDKVKEQVS